VGHHAAPRRPAHVALPVAMSYRRTHQTTHQTATNECNDTTHAVLMPRAQAMQPRGGSNVVTRTTQPAHEVQESSKAALALAGSAPEQA
jgi:hypothetical protein